MSELSNPPSLKRRRYPLKSEDAVREMAYRYMGRFSCTTEKLRIYLTKKLREAVQAEECRPSDIRPWVDRTLARLTELGILNDARYAESRAGTLHRRGRAERVIVRDLGLKGAPEAAIDHAIEALREEVADPDLAAAIHLARKRRLGPFCDHPDRAARRQKHLATLARAGFRFDLARRVIDAPDSEAALAMLDAATES